MDAIPSGIYRHYKGNDYRILSCATHSETQEQMVVYQPIYGEPSLWVRPLAMFTETVQLANGKRVQRFQLMTPLESPLPLPENVPTP
jgi:hypothetical protein